MLVSKTLSVIGNIESLLIAILTQNLATTAYNDATRGTDHFFRILFYSRSGQSAARKTILCGPRVLTEIYTPNVNQAKGDFFLQLCAECQ